MIGVAVVGAGNWGKNLVRNFAALPHAELKYICDLNATIRQTMTALYPHTVVTGDLDQALADRAVHAVVVAVDASLHHTVAKAALRAGKHTYVEKPLTLTRSDGEALIALAARHNLKLMVGHLLEYHPAIQYMKDMIHKGAIGEAFYLYFQRVNLDIVRQTENVWWSLAPHDISVACYLFEAEPVCVSALGQAYLQDHIEDVVFANLKFADGRMANMHVSWLDPHKIRKVTLVGEQKMVVFDDMEATEKSAFTTRVRKCAAAWRATSKRSRCAMATFSFRKSPPGNPSVWNASISLTVSSTMSPRAATAKTACASSKCSRPGASRWPSGVNRFVYKPYGVCKTSGVSDGCRESSLFCA